MAQRDLVLAERAGMIALVVGALALVGVVVVLAVRRSVRRRSAQQAAVAAPVTAVDDPSPGA